MQKPSLPKGTRDFGPLQAARRKYITNIIEGCYRRYGFSRIETPAMENLSVLTGKYGDEGDQLLFKILNSGDFLSKSNPEDFEGGSKKILPKISEKGLRYDLTVPFARFVVMNQHSISFPFKRYQIQPVWRADRPQKGRYREFYQCDADIIGTKSLWVEAELTLLINDVFKSLQLQEYEIRINHREILYAFAEKSGVSDQTTTFCTILDKLDKVPTDEVSTQLVALGAEQEIVSQLLNLIAKPLPFSQILSQLHELLPADNVGLRDLEEYATFLEDPDAANVVLDPGLARGLSYYTGIIYEVKPTSVKMGSICGGGRYDDLTGIFGLKDVSGVGISFGLDRIYDVLEELNLFPETSTGGTRVFLTHFDSESMKHGIGMVKDLRASGIFADIYPEVSKLKKQLNHANKLDVPYVITVGDVEMASGLYPVKNMESGKTEKLTLEQIISSFSAQD